MFFGVNNFILNNLSLPGNVAATRIRGCARPLMFRTGITVWPFENRGTATLYRFCNQYFSITSQHQYTRGKHSDAKENSFICLDFPGNAKCNASLIRGDAMAWIPNHDGMNEQNDLVVMRLSKKIVDPHSFGGVFFIDGEEPFIPANSESAVFLVFGYPEALRQSDLDEYGSNVHTNLKQVSVPVKKYNSESNGTISKFGFQPGAVLSKISNYSGFSGSLIIAFNLETRNVTLEGVVITGGNGQFRCVNTPR
jgi:hypothetical protein